MTIIRPQIPDDDPAVVQLVQELQPELPALTVEELRGERANVPPGTTQLEIVAQRDGKILGHAVLLERFWTGVSGSYSASVRVNREHWGQGIGSRLYNEIQARAGDSGALRLFSDVREDENSALEFAHRRGFKETGHIARVSKLDVRAANLEGYDALGERLSRDDIRITTLAELGTDDEELLRAVHRTQMTAAQDEPTPEPLDIPFDRWRSIVIRQPGVSPETVWVALAGAKPIGVTMLQRAGEDAARHFGMTVDRAYRGRGVARLLKLRQIQWAGQQGIRSLYTENDIDNPRMYDINIRLGYQPLPGTVGLVKDLSSGQ
jgi:GNAT superfamily N-acetyltransferase